MPTDRWTTWLGRKLYKLGINHAAQLGTHLLSLLLFLVRFVRGKSFWGEASSTLGRTCASRGRRTSGRGRALAAIPKASLPPAGFGFESRMADCTRSRRVQWKGSLRVQMVKLGLDLATATFLSCSWFCLSVSPDNVMETSLHPPQSRLELHARLDATRGGEENPQNLARSMN